MEKHVTSPRAVRDAASLPYVTRTPADLWAGGTLPSRTLAEALDRLDLTGREREEIHRGVAADMRGLAVYGSRARGDYVSTSDFDLLQLSRHPHGTFKAGRASVSCYTEAQLLSASRTLFGTHLIRDACVLFDPEGVLMRTLRALEPADPDDLLERVARYSIILGVSQAERATRLTGIVRLARYLTRTAVYAQAMKRGEPCFSVRELAARLDEPRLETLLASAPEITGPPTEVVLHELERRLEACIGPLKENPHGTLHATAVAFWDSDRLLATMAIRAAGEVSEDFDYSDLPKIML